MVSYRGCGQPFKVYAEAFVYAATLVTEKNVALAKATEKTCKKFDISITKEAVKKTHFLCESISL